MIPDSERQCACPDIFHVRDDLQPIWPVQEAPAPESVNEGKDVGFFLEHSKPFRWVQDFLIKGNAPSGPHHLTATYSADSNFAASSGTVDVFVGCRPPVVAPPVISAGDPHAYRGAGLTFAAQVTPGCRAATIRFVFTRSRTKSRRSLLVAV